MTYLQKNSSHLITRDKKQLEDYKFSIKVLNTILENWRRTTAIDDSLSTSHINVFIYYYLAFDDIARIGRYRLYQVTPCLFMPLIGYDYTPSQKQHLTQIARRIGITKMLTHNKYDGSIIGLKIPINSNLKVERCHQYDSNGLDEVTYYGYINQWLWGVCTLSYSQRTNYNRYNKLFTFMTLMSLDKEFIPQLTRLYWQRTNRFILMTLTLLDKEFIPQLPRLQYRINQKPIYMTDAKAKLLNNPFLKKPRSLSLVIPVNTTKIHNACHKFPIYLADRQYSDETHVYWFKNNPDHPLITCYQLSMKFFYENNQIISIYLKQIKAVEVNRQQENLPWLVKMIEKSMTKENKKKSDYTANTVCTFWSPQRILNQPQIQELHDQFGHDCCIL